MNMVDTRVKSLVLVVLAGCSTFGASLSEGQIVSIPVQQGAGFAGCHNLSSNRTLYRVMEQSGDYLKAESLTYFSENGKGTLSANLKKSVVFEFNLNVVNSYAICFDSFSEYKEIRDRGGS